MLPLTRLEDEPKSGAIFVNLFYSATLIEKSILFSSCLPIQDE